MNIKKMKLAELKPAPYNPRTISEAALRGLSASIKRFGLVEPIIVNKRSGNVVGGHQRLKVLEAEGETETDVVLVDLAEPEEKALNLALNNPAIAGNFTDDVRAILDELHESLPDVCNDLNLDAVAVGLANSLNQIEAEWRAMPDYTSKQVDYRRIVIHFQSEEAVQAFADLIKQTITSKTKAIHFPPIEGEGSKDIYYADDL